MGTVINCRVRGLKQEGNRRLPLLLMMLLLLPGKLWGCPHTGAEGNALPHVRMFIAVE